MHVLKIDKGGFIHPESKSETYKQSQPLGTLNGYGGKMYVISVPIPSDADSYADFTEKMGQIESDLRTSIEGIANLP